jgi:hypothetical protein
MKLYTTLLTTYPTLNGDGDGVEGYVGGEEVCNCGCGGVIMIMAAFEEVGAEKCREVDIRMAFTDGV